MGERARGTSKPKGKVVAEKKMHPRNARVTLEQKQQKQQKQQELLLKQEQTAQENAARLIQRATRAIMVRKGFAGLLALEDHVLRIPTPARRALDRLSSEPGLHGDLGQLDEYLGIRTDDTEGSEEGSLKASSSGLLSQQSSKRPIRSGGRAARRQSEMQGQGTPWTEYGVSEQMLRGHLEAALPDSKFSASKVLWLFSTQHLGLSHLQRIYTHHELRRKNVNRQVRLRLVVVQHGDSTGVVRTRAGSDPVSPAAAGKNVLLPEGWLQVTRTSWSLRLQTEFRPDLICSSTVPCCVETAERIRGVLDDAGEGDGGAAGQDQDRGAAGVLPVCLQETLDPASLAGTGTAGRLHRVAAALIGAVSTLPAPQETAEGLLPPPCVLLLVAGGATLEVLLACLCAGSGPAAASRAGAAASKAEASGNEAAQAAQGAPPLPRLGGGDGVLLASPPLMRVCTARRKTRSRRERSRSGREEERRTESRQQSRGEAEEPDEVVRPIEELWRVALLRGQWSVHHHFRGQERPPPPQGERLGEEALEQQLGPAWRSYAGEPLVLSSDEFAQLCRRAGTSFMPVSPQATATLRPLVNDLR